MDAYTRKWEDRTLEFERIDLKMLASKFFENESQWNGYAQNE